MSPRMAVGWTRYYREFYNLLRQLYYGKNVTVAQSTQNEELQEQGLCAVR